MSYRTVRHASGSEGYLDVACSSCGTGLEPVFKGHTDDDGAWESLQAEGALHLRIDGGYGMFIDPITRHTDPDPQPVDFLLCEECSKKLAAENPWLTRTLERYISSSIGHVCDDDKFVWVARSDCMRSKNHGIALPDRRRDEDEP